MDTEGKYLFQSAEPPRMWMVRPGVFVWSVRATNEHGELVYVPVPVNHTPDGKYIYLTSDGGRQTV